ncbi:putative BTB/POZ domain, NPH3 domain, NPH3/RPT2-like family protein [Helianthus annuus]|uniref:BTB/POZ domain, NPH3 domain-containing protein n=1 Tax=Helianthus annuus TaxID=4232 RepID=A0A251T413_HELAN|nr:BTB/POZ domain-containing protein NPY3 [Helianthus annuus]KAF5791588.1 putative BTB/POZ domain, NPH3 domain-containing protein [Helianthus annuus]KAJ0526630.1 putative BTB/POZ domain, NPH3 domain, NPH3/RPT2-like family protein [Helianthus annuus]KAJ0535136.1 putative BTB/POZ domain, NPH3 domain, NPH3/RPT2-like family protein [Helianthus annuus]KAJ0543024.1 putative BTB/POZ domain, NPH3 domain, NPH3/RPT2-like family protein [Helianthus annuus]KAJ0708079.1 putative BTB/POZ domain, NPH3 domain
MKFMKLGSKPDLFQSNGENTRYVATDLAADMIVSVGDVKFYVHKFPLLSKSARLQKLVAVSENGNNEEIEINDIPGGPTAFEICAKFCYGMTVTLNAYNVVMARCAAEYLEMYETVDKGNLVYKIEVFLNSSVFRTWKDSIIVFQSTKGLVPWSDELKVVSHCLESIASKVSVDTSKVEWSYTYNRKKQQVMVPKDWWVEDLCDLSSDLYKRVMIAIKAKGKTSSDVVGECLRFYVQKRLPWFGKRNRKNDGDGVKARSLIEMITELLPDENESVSCGFLVHLLHACVRLECGGTRKKELMRRIGNQLQNATISDIVILDVDLVQELVAIFMMRDQNNEIELSEVRHVDSDAKVSVAKIIDGYLAEIAKEPNTSLLKFADLGDMVSSLPRSTHDGIYRAIDMYLKEHPGIGKSEKKRICRLMDCRKLSPDACKHAVQNERLPLRVVVQVLFFEQLRVTSSGGMAAEAAMGLAPGGSSRTNTEEEWGSVPTSEELKALKGEVEKDGEKMNKAKGAVISKRIFMKVFSSKDKDSDNGSSDTSESRSTNAEETKSGTPTSRSQRHSLS